MSTTPSAQNSVSTVWDSVTKWMITHSKFRIMWWSSAGSIHACCSPTRTSVPAVAAVELMSVQIGAFQTAKSAPWAANVTNCSEARSDGCIGKGGTNDPAASTVEHIVIQVDSFAWAISNEPGWARASSTDARGRLGGAPPAAVLRVARDVDLTAVAFATVAIAPPPRTVLLCEPTERNTSIHIQQRPQSTQNNAIAFQPPLPAFYFEKHFILWDSVSHSV